MMNGRIIGAGLIALALAGGGAYIERMRSHVELSDVLRTHAETLQAISDKTAAVVIAQQQHDTLQTAAVANLEKEGNAKIAEISASADSLRACLNSGACRLRYAGTPAVSGSTVQQAAATPGADDAAGARPDAAVERDYLTLVSGLQRQREQIAICQKYAELIQK